VLVENHGVYPLSFVSAFVSSYIINIRGGYPQVNRKILKIIKNILRRLVEYDILNGEVEMLANVATMFRMENKKRKPGRPRTNPEKSSGDRHAAHKVVRIPPELWEELAEIAKGFGRLTAQEVRWALRLYVEQMKQKKQEP
jgi:hypothetical protein